MVRIPSAHEVEAFRYESLQKEIFAAAEKLPPFPDVVWKVIPLIRNMAHVSEIEAVIAYDPAISARVLSLSQSSYYARRRRVDSLSDAVGVLGGRRLIQVILTACANRYFSGETGRTDPNERQLWEHSVTVALGVEMLALRHGRSDALKMYLAGLLHDIGKTVLNSYLKIYGNSAPGEADIPGSDSLHSLDAEHRILGVDHQTLGRAIALRWRLPGEVTMAIGYHHSPGNAPNNSDFARMVYVADRLARTMNGPRSDNGPQSGANQPGALADDEIFAQFGISAPVADEMRAQLEEAVEGVRRFLTFDGASSPKAAESGAALCAPGN